MLDSEGSLEFEVVDSTGLLEVAEVVDSTGLLDVFEVADSADLLEAVIKLEVE